jgi:cytochrome c-type biogenesis protein CcmH
MTEFWLPALLLTIFALAFVLIPLLRNSASSGQTIDSDSLNIGVYKDRLAEIDKELSLGMLDKAEWQKLKLELDRSLLADQGGEQTHQVGHLINKFWLVFIIILALPASAWFLYGEWGALNEVSIGQQLKELREGDKNSQQLQAILDRVERQTSKNPDNAQYWNLLSRMYMSSQRYGDAARAFQQLAKLYPQDSGVLARYAQAMYLASGNQITPSIQDLIEQVRSMDPRQPTLLGMLGMNAFENANYSGAVDYWSQLLEVLPAGSPDAQMIQSGIQQARTMGGLATEEPVTTEAQAAGQARVLVKVSLGADVSAEPNSTVYVFAKALQGPKMPLAVAKLAVSELPTEVVLDDTMAMTPQLKLSLFEQIALVARVSASGDVSAKPGDLEGVLKPVVTRAEIPVELVINSVVGQ